MIPKEVFEETLLGLFSPIRPFLEDASVTEIMINGPGDILIERRGRIERTNARFSSGQQLTAALRNLAQYAGRHFDKGRPILEAHFPDGSRVEAVLPPAAPDGPNVAIRRFYREKLTVDKLIEFGSLTPSAAKVIAALVACKQNVIIAGGTASGKTSLLNAFSSCIPEDERIVLIEDNRELQLQQAHVVHLEAQPPDARGQNEVTIRDLFRASLRLRPDRIVVGEIRGGEALDLIQAMTSGHSGCLSTVHATHALDTLSRLETMALMSDVQLPLTALRMQVASAVNFIVHASRLADGFRCITSLTEVTGYDMESGFRTRDIFARCYQGREEDGRVRSELRATGAVPSALAYFRSMGYELPAALFEAPSP